MLILDAAEIEELASMGHLVDVLRSAFAAEWQVPARSVVPLPGMAGRLLLCMPAFGADGAGVIKASTVFPDNGAMGLPTIQGLIILFSQTGSPVAILDGPAVTCFRTGAASALASTYLSRADSRHLLILGTGALAPFMALAHCAVRPISRVTVWGRDPARAQATAFAIGSRIPGHIAVDCAASLDAAAAVADIICCATASADPVLMGEWVQQGTFVDLVGSFSPDKRETDDMVMLKSRIFVDTLEGALTEAGDILDPLARNVIARDQIAGDLPDLCAGRVSGRRSDDEIIVFKSVGCAIEDLAAARFLFDTAARRREAPEKKF